MATHLRIDLDIHTVADVVDAVAAGLHADPATTSLAATWDAMRDKADAIAADVRARRRASRRSRARLAVADQVADDDHAALGRAALDVAIGDRGAEPYRSLYGDVPPSEAQKFGAARSVAFGRRTAAELERVGGPLQASFGARVAASTNALEAALAERGAAALAESTASSAADVFIEDVNRELDRLEGDLLRLFPRASGRVAAFLSPTRREPAARKADRGGDETSGADL
jgi:hypothetical protein